MVKITAVLIVVYFWYKGRTKMHINSLSNIDKLRFSIKNYTVSEKRMIVIFGTLHVLMYLSISITLLHFVFTHF